MPQLPATAPGQPLARMFSPANAQKFVTQVAAQQLRRSLRKFAQRCWDQMVPTPMIWNWHLDAIADHLSFVTMGEIRFLMINICPRHSKTMIASVIWPAWHWLHVPGEQFLTASVDATLASQSSLLSRRLIESAWYQRQWPGEIELFDDENQVGMYRNKKGGYRITTSVQGRVTGVGGTTQIGDDFHDAKKIESDAYRHASLAWHDNAWRSRLNDPERSKKVYIGQRTHEHDIYGHVLEQEGQRWVHLVLPFEFDHKARCITFANPKGREPDRTRELFRDPRTTEREVLDPKRFSAETAMAEKAIMSERAWEAQYNQRPLGQGGLILKRHWWRSWVHPEWRPNAGQPMALPSFAEIIQVYDTAFEEDEEADFSARTTWGLFQHQEMALDPKTGKPIFGMKRMCAMLLDRMNERLSWPDLRAEAVKSNGEFEPDWILVEKKASGHSLVQELKRKALPVKAVSLRGSGGRKGMQGDLIARAHMASLMLEKGCIFYPVEPWAYEVLDQCSKFPNGDNDDMVATVVIAWMYMRRYHDLEFPDDDSDEIAVFDGRRRQTVSRPIKVYA